MNEQEEKLLHHGIRPTAMRMLVLECFSKADHTLTLRDLETLLHPADRSTIFRTLTLFERHGLLHLIDDGGGATRYELCHSRHDDGEHDDHHLHFRCLQCGRTICLNEHRVPAVELPEGFSVQRINYIAIGTCPDCSKGNKG